MPPSGVYRLVVLLASLSAFRMGPSLLVSGQPVASPQANSSTALSASAASGAGDWNRGRVTYYGAPASVAAAYDPSRGNGSFGILAYGSCGYTNTGGSLPFPAAQYAASTSASPDYPGSCGRCYDIRCITGPVLNNEGQPITIVQKDFPGRGSNVSYYEGDEFRPYLPSINPNVVDTQGQRFPGNSEAAAGQQITECYDQNQVLRIRIADSCPCTQVLRAGAPGVAAGGETRTQQWCCGTNNIEHFDINYGAFQQLAHPVYGVAMIEYRPVDCSTGAALPFSPGYIDKGTIYSGGPRPGWSWQPYDSATSELIVPSAPSPAGTASTCLTVSPKGGVLFKCRDCYKSGYQPFAGATAISFWIRPNSNSPDPYVSSTPTGSKPNLQLILQKAETGNYCAAEPTTGSLTPAATAGDWYQFVVPTSDFACDRGGISLADVDQFEFQNPNIRNAVVCIAEIKIVH